MTQDNSRSIYDTLIDKVGFFDKEVNIHATNHKVIIPACREGEIKTNIMAPNELSESSSPMIASTEWDSEICRVSIEDFIWESWVKAFSFETRTKQLHLYCAPSLLNSFNTLCRCYIIPFLFPCNIYYTNPDALHIPSHKVVDVFLYSKCHPPWDVYWPLTLVDMKIKKMIKTYIKK